MSQRGKMRLFGGFMPYIKLIRCKTTNKALYPRETDSSFKQFEFRQHFREHSVSNGNQ